MKMVMYTNKNADGLCGLPYCASTEYYVAKSIQTFYQKVGKYEPLSWWILGEYDMDSCKLTPCEPRLFDWEKCISDTEISVSTEALETSSLAKEVECNEG